MLFSSMSFIFVFLPIVSFAYFLIGKKLKNIFLLMASIIFYAWGEPRYLYIMFLTIFINYIGALSLGPAKDKINISIEHRFATRNFILYISGYQLFD